MRHNDHHRRWPSPRPLALLALPLAGCMSGPPADDTSTEAQALYGNADYFWPDAGTGRTDIKVCWENPESTEIGSTTAARAAWRDARREAVQQSWSRHARINFYGWGPCSSAASPNLRVVICDQFYMSWNGTQYVKIRSDARCPALPASQSGGAYGSSPSIDGLANGLRLNPDHGVGAMVHEVGHVLGFYHEEERYNTTNMPTVACDTLNSGWSNSSPVTYGGIYWGTGSGNPDEWGSVMAYCHPPNAAPWLNRYDVASIQRAYGRRQPGSLVTPRAHCAAAHQAAGSGDQAFVWDCDEYANDQEYSDTTAWSDGDAWNLQLASSSPALCLEPLAHSAGSMVTLWTCSASSASYDWRFERMYVQGFGGLCLDLQNGNTAAGTPIQVWRCGVFGGANQRWTRTRAGQIRYGATGMCARVDPSTSRLVLASCNAADDNQRFSFSGGKIRRLSDATACLDVQGPSDAQFHPASGTGGSGGPVNGALVQQYTCNTSMNQRWNLRGALRYGGNANLCLARASDANPGDGGDNRLSLQTCLATDGSDPSFTATQEWDYYF